MIKKIFNLVIVGVGGQGLITLLKILSQAALIENKNCKTSEIHGLSQRGGSVEAHFRLANTGIKIFSPLVSQTDADLVLSLELQESLKAHYYASHKTNFLINDYVLPIIQEKISTKKEVLNSLEKITKHNEIIPAEKICQEKLNNTLVSGIYLLGYAIKKKLIPLKSESILKAIKEIVPPQYLELNINAYNLS